MAVQSRLYKGISIEELRRCLSYDASTGLFTWLINPSTRRKSGDLAGKITNIGYRVIGYKHQFLLGHVIAWAFIYGDFPGHPIDHINLVKSDNRAANLRPCTIQLNAANRGTFVNSTTGAKGVTFNKERRKYKAYITINGKQHHLGMFTNIADAQAAYAAKANMAFGEYGRAS